MTEKKTSSGFGGWLLVGLFVLMAAGAVAAWAVLLEQPRRARVAATEMIRSQPGGEVETVSNCPDWAKGTWAEDYFTYVVGVRVLQSESMSPDDLRYLAAFPDLDWLDITLPAKPDGIIEALPHNQDLYELKLSNPRRLPEPRLVPNVDTLEITFPQWGPGDAGVLAGYQNVERLRLLITDPLVLTEALAAASRLPKLEELRLEYSNVPARALAPLEHCSTLLLLDVTNCNLDIEAVKVLSRITSLQHLELDNRSTTSYAQNVAGRVVRYEPNQIDDDALEHVGKLTDLRLLQLDRTDVGDEGLDHLDRINYLQFLYLADTRIGNEGVRHLTKHPYLSRLNLRKNWHAQAIIDDAAVDDLLTLVHLEALDLLYTDLSNDGLTRLRVGLPKARVEPHTARRVPSDLKKEQLKQERASG